MAVRVLVVDDSGFFRRRVTEILSIDPGLQVVGSAANGLEAVEKTAQLKPDVITMDIEMPVMDGITAVRKIMAATPTPILMFSTLTTAGAQATLDALDAGALDFLPKRFEDISANTEEAKRQLCARVRALGSRRLSSRSASAPAAGIPPARPSLPPKNLNPAHPAPLSSPTHSAAIHGLLRKGQARIVLIGTSTGGPIALQQVLTKLPKNFPAPILLVQHMPPAFTPAFAQRLDKLCAIHVKEAQDGDLLAPGTALLAPGGRQMVLEKKGGRVQISVMDDPAQHYKPSVDLTFSSAARFYPGQTLGVILTGMGADGREGARLLKQGGSIIWAQDEDSCVVYGMPMAVAEAGLVDQVLPLAEIGSALAQRV